MDSRQMGTHVNGTRRSALMTMIAALAGARVSAAHVVQ
jgi:hypothetical protein